MIQSHTPRQKLSAIGTLLEELVLLMLSVALILMLLIVIGNVIAHFLMGYSWAWEKAHAVDGMFFFILIATPLLLLGGLAWMALRDEYRRILRARMREW